MVWKVKWNETTRKSENLIQLKKKANLEEYDIVAEKIQDFQETSRTKFFPTMEVLMQKWNQQVRTILKNSLCANRTLGEDLAPN